MTQKTPCVSNNDQGGNVLHGLEDTFWDSKVDLLTNTLHLASCGNRDRQGFDVGHVQGLVQAAGTLVGLPEGVTTGDCVADFAGVDGGDQVDFVVRVAGARFGAFRPYCRFAATGL